MKEEFFGYYEPTKKEIDKSWAEGTFIFDTNSLLNLYRYSKSTQVDFLLAIEKLGDRVFMPYQVGHEFHSNRRAVIEGLTNSYNSLLTGIKDIFDKNINGHLNQFKRHPSIELSAINDILDDFIKKLNIILDKQKKKHPDFSSSDTILDTLTTIYENKVGKKLTKEELKKLYEEGKDRYEQSIPPGYKDLDAKKKKGDQHVYGDLIIWKEIIAYCKRERKNVILVTDDRKEDWWTIENGQTVGPREELIKEFFDLTKTRILIYNTDNFLRFARERKILSKIKEESIKEVKEIRKADETFNNFYDMMSNLNLGRYAQLDSELKNASKFLSNIVPSFAKNPELLLAPNYVNGFAPNGNHFRNYLVHSFNPDRTVAELMAEEKSIPELMSTMSPLTHQEITKASGLVKPLDELEKAKPNSESEKQKK